MKLVVITDSQKPEYQSFVSANGCFLQDWDWGEFQKHLGKKIVRVVVLEGESIILSAQLIINEFKGKQYLFAPYGPVVNSAAENKLEVLNYFFEALSKKYPEQVFIRFEPQFDFETDNKKVRRSIDLDPHKTLVLDLQKDLETLQKEMHPKTRYNIKIADKRNVQISVQNKFSPEEKEIFDQTSSRAGVRFQGAEYFSEILNFFSEENKAGGNIEALLYRGEVDGQVIAANLMIHWNKTAIYLFGGSSNQHRNAMAPYGLHWRSIQDFKAKGAEVYDFWGVEEDPNHPWYGFSRFKLGFGGTVIKYAGTMDYVIKPAWYNAYILLRKLNRIVRK